MNRLIITLFLLCGLASAQYDFGLQIMDESESRLRAGTQQYEGTLEVISASNKVSVKHWKYRRIGSNGASKAILRFTAPAEVKGVALLIVNHADRSSDQWMWTPAIERDRRIAAQDRSTRFFGTDFSFEDLEERDVDQFDYKFQAEDTIGGVVCWKIESKPRPSVSSQYTSSMLWVRKDNYVAAQIENFLERQTHPPHSLQRHSKRQQHLDATNGGGVRRYPQKPDRAEARKAGIQRADEGRRLHA